MPRMCAFSLFSRLSELCSLLTSAPPYSFSAGSVACISPIRSIGRYIDRSVAKIQSRRGGNQEGITLCDWRLGQIPLMDRLTPFLAALSWVLPKGVFILVKELLFIGKLGKELRMVRSTFIFHASSESVMYFWRQVVYASPRLSVTNSSALPCIAPCP